QNDRERSIRLEMLTGLADERAEFFSLQQGVAAEQSANPPRGMQLIDHACEFENMADTAGLIAHLDLVIAVDTSVAHLAGAMGKPIWVLMALVPDWRWMLERADTPWYPTMRLFRQAKLNEWSELIAHLTYEFKRWLSR
ncbi:MAG: glycosyl transferase family 8, partial [Phycisphaerae bacterium]|nr:glycosyl transferase family 8 [Phycisphaerae bacterium]